MSRFKAARHVLGGKSRKKIRSVRGRRKIKKTVDEWKAGTLHSGSKTGPVVKSQKQAVAISLSQGRKHVRKGSPENEHNRTSTSETGV
jgi:hypothetical protein